MADVTLTPAADGDRTLTPAGEGEQGTALVSGGSHNALVGRGTPGTHPTSAVTHDGVALDQILAGLGAGAVAYTHTQAVPSAEWTVPHGLSFPPAVTVLTSAGDIAHGDIVYAAGTVVLSFSGAFAGVAYLS